MTKRGYLNVPVTDVMKAQLDAICARLGIDPAARGAYTAAIAFAVQRAVYDDQPPPAPPTAPE